MLKTKIVKTNLKLLIKSIKTLNFEKKKKWLELVDIVSEEEREHIYTYFKDLKKQERELSLKLIVKHGLEKRLASSIKEVTKLFVKNIKNKHKK